MLLTSPSPSPLAVWKFAVGIFFGGLKPYLLDSYLGTLGLGLVAGEASGGVDDNVVIAVVSFAVAVGALASSLATDGWEEVKLEMEMDKLGKLADGGGEGVDGEGAESKEEDGWLDQFGGIKAWYTTWEAKVKEADKTIRAVVDQEYDLKLFELEEDGSEAISEEIVKRGIVFKDLASSPEGEPFSLGKNTIEGLVFLFTLVKVYGEYSDPNTDIDGLYKTLILPV